MPKLSDLLTALEKLTSFPFFMFITSLALFINLYLIYNHGITIGHLNTEWIKAHATVGEVLTFGVWFVVLYLFTFPILHWFTRVIVSTIYFKLSISVSSKSFRSDCVLLTTLRDFAVQNNNSVAYKVYEDMTVALNKHESDMEYMRSSCFATLMLTIVHFVWFFPFVYAELARLPRFFALPWLGLLCWVIYHAYQDISGSSMDNEYVYLPSFESSDKERVRH